MCTQILLDISVTCGTQWDVFDICAAFVLNFLWRIEASADPRSLEQIA